MRTIVIIIALLFLCGKVGAEPTSGRMNVISVRPYVGDVVYIQLAASDFCNTDFFAVDTAAKNGKEVYAAALAAVITGKKVTVEAANATGCAGWGTRLQSIILIQ